MPNFFVGFLVLATLYFFCLLMFVLSKIVYLFFVNKPIKTANQQPDDNQNVHENKIIDDNQNHSYCPTKVYIIKKRVAPKKKRQVNKPKTIDIPLKSTIIQSEVIEGIEKIY